MEPHEADALVRQAKGRLCVRFQVDAQGRVVHRRRSRWVRWGVAALAALAGTPALASGRVDTEQGVSGWIAEVASSIVTQVKGEAAEAEVIMGEMAIEAEPRAFENRTDAALVVDCGLEKATIDPGATATLEAWPYEACTVQSAGDTMHIEADQVVCTRTSEGVDCAAAPTDRR